MSFPREATHTCLSTTCSTTKFTALPRACWLSHEILTKRLEVTYYQSRAHSPYKKKTKTKTNQDKHPFFLLCPLLFPMFSHHSKQSTMSPLFQTELCHLWDFHTRYELLTFLFFFFIWASFSQLHRDNFLYDPLFTSKFDVQWDFKISGLAG